jgi:acyl carrier protein
MKKEIVKIVNYAVSQFANENGIKELRNPVPGTALFGSDSAIDSIGLVSIIVEIESRISEELDISVSLADEKAMSQKNSPFRTIKSLSDYIEDAIERQK